MRTLTPNVEDRCRGALAAFLGGIARDPEAVRLTPLGNGLINETYLVEAPPAPRVLQLVSPLFGIEVHEDIEAVTRHLRERGLPSPLLQRAADGALAVRHAGGVYRLMDFVPGKTHDVMDPALAREAGRLVGRFHLALADLAHAFRFCRPGAHDLPRHLEALRAARAAAGSAADPQFFAVADEILARAAALPAAVPGPLRVCHGDLKLNNLRFDEEGRGLCLLDLDTLGRLPLGIELGDALRSWCNPAGEDDPEAGRLDLELFRLAVAGYAETAGPMLTEDEWAQLAPGVLRLALELAARFCADVVNDRYFRHDPARFPTRAAHNLARARGQLALARSAAAQLDEARAIVASLRAP